MRVQIRNYQAIKKADLEFEPGLNLIVGPTNAGKTAILRAIESAIFNELGDWFIHWDESFSAVKVQMDGHQVIWRKNKSKADKTVYEVDGRVFRKVGRGQLPEVCEALKIGEVKLLASKERLNFIHQMSYPFLLDKTPSQLFEFLSLASEGDNLSLILKEMRSDADRMQKEITHFEGGLDALTAAIVEGRDRLKLFDGFDGVFDEVVTSGDFFDDVGALESLVLSCDHLKQQKDLAIRRFQSVFSITSPLSKGCASLEPVISDIALFEQSIEDLDSRLVDLESAVAQVEELSSVVGELLVLSELDSEISSLSELEVAIDLVETSQGLWESRHSEVLSIDVQLEAVLKELGSFSVCPLCGSVLKEGA